MRAKKPDIKSAKKHLERIYQLQAMRKSPFDGMSDEEIMERLRKTREALWEKKFAPRS